MKIPMSDLLKMVMSLQTPGSRGICNLLRIKIRLLLNRNIF